jgi:hypothetical protein
MTNDTIIFSIQTILDRLSTLPNHPSLTLFICFDLLRESMGDRIFLFIFHITLDPPSIMAALMLFR